MDIFSLAGRTALVTGSSRGIGLAIAEGLAAAGARLVLNGRDAERLGEAAGRLGADTLVFDTGDAAAVTEAVDRYEAEKGPIHILINNAGTQHRARLDEFPPERFDEIMRVNLTGVFNVAQAVARHMIPRGEGKIVNIASATTFIARRSIAPYTASKAAVAGLTRGMAVDWAALGLNCNAIAPGYFATEINRDLRTDPTFDGWLKGRTPAGRWGEVSELVGAAVFLSSAASTFVNGHTLVVDGGLTIAM
jgi:gluconate 5-dehydrogenase